ncbi:hypothetical protein Ae201684P_009579 [Aphanomyces euteiches]|nr:hypothetical protein Ae201684P_009579 [Aphanomyces euteiches]
MSSVLLIALSLSIVVSQIVFPYCIEVRHTLAITPSLRTTPCAAKPLSTRVLMMLLLVNTVFFYGIRRIWARVTASAQDRHRRTERQFCLDGRFFTVLLDAATSA